jgi:hypothetical protein
MDRPTRSRLHLPGYLVNTCPRRFRLVASTPGEPDPEGVVAGPRLHQDCGSKRIAIDEQTEEQTSRPDATCHVEGMPPSGEGSGRSEAKAGK